MKFVYNIGEVIHDCMGSKGMILDRKQHHNEPTYKVAFVKDDWGSCRVCWCEELDLFSPLTKEELLRLEIEDEGYATARKEGLTYQESFELSRNASKALRLVK